MLRKAAYLSSWTGPLRGPPLNRGVSRLSETEASP